MKAKYDVQYINGKVDSFTKGALSVESVQMEALRLSHNSKVLRVVYTIQDSMSNLDMLENLSEVLSIWTGYFPVNVTEWQKYKSKYHSTYDAMMYVLQDAEHLYGYNQTEDTEDSVHLHWFLKRFIEHAKQDILWIYEYLHTLPKLTVDLNTLPLEELFDVYYQKAEFFAEKACEERGLEVRRYLHQNVQTLKEHIQE